MLAGFEHACDAGATAPRPVATSAAEPPTAARLTGLTAQLTNRQVVAAEYDVLVVDKDPEAKVRAGRGFGVMSCHVMCQNAC